MKKIVLLCVLLCLCFFALNTFAFASEGEAGVEREEIVLDEEGTKREEDLTQKNDFFTSLYLMYEENKGELFSLLSAVVSLVLVFVYRKGLIPILKSGISLIEGQVKGLREINTTTKEENKRVSEEALALATRMQSATEEMRQMTALLLKAEEEGASRSVELEKMRQCILWQANLLGEVFLASSLPEYSKERVGRVVAEVETMLTSEAKEDK